MNKSLLSIASAGVFLVSQMVGATNITSIGTGNILQVTPNTTLGSPVTPYMVRACCNAQGDTAYCSKFTVNVDVFDVTAATECKFAGVKLSPDHYPTNCIVQGNGMCSFSIKPSDGARTIPMTENVVVRATTPLWTQNLLYGVQVVATGWPKQTPPSDWGFNGSGPVNFNIPGNYIEANLVIPQPIDACGSITNPTVIAGKIALIKRGTCQFGLKGLNVQTAGAIGFVVFNNISGDITNMSPGTYGGSVEIPGAFIQQSDGQILSNILNAGQRVTLIMGNIS